MRKNYLALAAAGLILASCQKDNEPSAQLPPTAPQSAMTLLGTIDASAPESRTHLDEEAGGGGNSSLVKWDLYDAVALYMTGAFDRRVQELADSVAQGLQPSIQFVTPEFYVVKSAESIDNTTATFTGTSAVTPLASDTYVAVYPYRSVSTDAWQIGRTHIRMTLPEQQSHPFQFKDLGMMIAKTPDSGSEQVRLSFKNIFPILKFSLTGSRTLAAIRFRGNDGEPVAGDFRLDISGDAYMEADFSESTVEEVSLTCGVQLSATPQTFYMVVPPQTYAKGYTIDFVADDGSVMTQVVSKDTPKTLLRSKIYEYPTLAFTPQSTAEAARDWLWQDETGVVSNVGFDELPGAVDLGAAANCFIVSAPGNYKFKAVKGDGSAVDGVDGYVYFTAGAAKGNAVIAALVNRQVAWSWHIWRSIMRSPNTSRSPLGVSNVRGTNLEPNPAAMINAPSTLYPSKRRRPSPVSSHPEPPPPSVRSAMYPFPMHSLISPLTVPRDTLSFCAISLWVISGCSSTVLHTSPCLSINTNPRFRPIYVQNMYLIKIYEHYSTSTGKCKPDQDYMERA